MAADLLVALGRYLRGSRFGLLALLMAVAPATAPAAEPTTKAIGVVQAAERLGSNRRALLIGINDYADPRIPDLKFAESDARALRDALVDPAVGGFAAADVRLLLGQDASALHIRKALYDLRTAGKDDLVVIYFSGHGAKQGGESFWVTQDAVLAELGPTALPNAELARLLEAIPSERIVTLLDCCYAADTVLNQKALVNVDDVAKSFTGKGRVTIAGAGGGEEAVEAEGLRQGVFTHFVVAGLRGAADDNNDGVVTLIELWRYLEPRVLDAARQQRGVQKPTMHMREGQQTERFLLTLNPAAAAEVQRGIAKLKELFTADKITAAQYEEGRRLLGTPSAPGAESKRRKVYSDLVQGRLAPEYLGAALGGVSAPTAAVSAAPSPTTVGPATKPAPKAHSVAPSPATLDTSGIATAEWWVGRAHEHAVSLPSGEETNLLLRSLAGLHAAIGDMPSANNCISRLEDPIEQKVASWEVAEYMAWARPLDEAMTYARSFKLEDQGTALSYVAYGALRAGRIEDAIRATGLIDEKNDYHGIYKSGALEACSRTAQAAGDLARAETLARQMEADGYKYAKVSALGRISALQAARGMHDAATRSLECAVQIALTSEDQPRFLEAVSSGLCRGGDMARGQNLARQYKIQLDEKEVAVSYGWFLVDEKRFPEAKASFAKVSGKTACEHHCNLAENLGRIAVKQHRAGDSEAAQQTLSEAAAAALNIPSECTYRSSSLILLSECAFAIGETDVGRKMAGLVSDPTQRESLRMREWLWRCHAQLKAEPADVPRLLDDCYREMVIGKEGIQRARNCCSMAAMLLQYRISPSSGVPWK